MQCFEMRLSQRPAISALLRVNVYPIPEIGARELGIHLLESVIVPPLYSGRAYASVSK